MNRQVGIFIGYETSTHAQRVGTAYIVERSTAQPIETVSIGHSSTPANADSVRRSTAHSKKRVHSIYLWQSLIINRLNYIIVL